MSTIIVPGGSTGMHITIVNTIINAVIIYFAFKIVQVYLKHLIDNKTTDIIEVVTSTANDMYSFFSPSIIFEKNQDTASSPATGTWSPPIKAETPTGPKDKGEGLTTDKISKPRLPGMPVKP